MINHHLFVGGSQGTWAVNSQTAVCGEALDPVSHVAVIELASFPEARLQHGGHWALQGFTSNIRYTERHEMVKLRAKQEGLNRPEATLAALIPIRKNAQWWAMPQDERRQIFEAQSRHTEIGLVYLPQIARRLHHCRDIGEPFDFITWFEFAPQYEADFNELLTRLRASAEWRYVEREVDIRLCKI